MTPPDETTWRAWTPSELAHRLAPLSTSWCIVGGWALDLWHGQQMRPHEDLEFTILRADLETCRASLAELDFFAVRDGVLSFLAPGASAPEDITQIWGSDRQHGCWRVDMMPEPGTAERWVYKRDPTFHMPRSQAIRTSANGICYLAPALVLLFKAKYCRSKDQRDFHAALPRLSSHERRQLGTWLEHQHPGHDWIAALQTPSDPGAA